MDMLFFDDVLSDAQPINCGVVTFSILTSLV